MSELLNFILDHEDAFKSKARLASLYSDFSYQAKSNPDGYAANISAWRQAISRALQAGKIPSSRVAGGGSGSGNNTLLLETGEELSRALNTKTWGRPVALGNVIQDEIDKRQLIPLDEFMSAKTSIYSRTWLPSPWQVVSWGLRQLGLVNRDSGDKLGVGRFVVMDNVEAAAKSLLSQISENSHSPTSNIHSIATFTHAYPHLFGTTNASLSAEDTKILLTYLSRDKPTISYSPSTGVINLTPAHPNAPITTHDTSIANLKTLHEALEAQLPALESRVATLSQRARAAVTASNLSSAKALLRSKAAVSDALATRRAHAAQLGEILGAIDAAHDQVAVVAAMADGARVLRALNAAVGGAERAARVADALRERVAEVEDVAAVLGEVGVEGARVDEGEVEEELEELERAQRVERERAEREARRAEDERKAAEVKRMLAELDEVERKRREALAKDEVKANQEEKEPPEVKETESQPVQITLPERPAVSAESKVEDDQHEKEAIPAS